MKTILRLEEEDKRGVTTIREKEQFSHSLNLLFADGRIATLTADARADEEETSNPKGKADSSVSVEAPPALGRKFRLNEDV